LALVAVTVAATRSRCLANSEWQPPLSAAGSLELGYGAATAREAGERAAKREHRCQRHGCQKQCQMPTAPLALALAAGIALDKRLLPHIPDDPSPALG